MRCWTTCFLASILLGCGGENSASKVKVPGDDPSAKTSTLATGAAALQNREPVDQLTVYVNGFHFYSGNMQGQMEAHHYCTVVNEDMNQCVMFDSNGSDAKLMGIEYIVSQKLFDRLPDEEKKLWHSHVYEVKSGQLIAPGIPQAAETALMEKLVGTYGKTWQTWHTDRQDELPIGPPMLMMGFTADGQIRPEMLAARDGRFDVHAAEKRKARADVATPSIDPAADLWQKEPAPQVFIGNAKAH